MWIAHDAFSSTIDDKIGLLTHYCNLYHDVLLTIWLGCTLAEQLPHVDQTLPGYFWLENKYQGEKRD
jgi:hypothetical protein